MKLYGMGTVILLVAMMAAVVGVDIRVLQEEPDFLVLGSQRFREDGVCPGEGVLYCSR